MPRIRNATPYLAREACVETQVDSGISVELQTEVFRGDGNNEVGQLFNGDFALQERSFHRVGQNVAVHGDDE